MKSTKNDSCTWIKNNEHWILNCYHWDNENVCTGSFDFRAKTLSVCIGFDIPKCNLTIGENFYGSLESNGFHTKKFLRMKWFALRSAEVRCFFQIRIYIFRWRSSCWSPEKVLRSSVCVPLLLWNKSIKLYDTFSALLYICTLNFPKIKIIKERVTSR